MSNSKTMKKYEILWKSIVAAIYESGHATVIPSAEGPTMAGRCFRPWFPSQRRPTLAGESAKRQATTNAEGQSLK
jgi:hypothetical protein